MSNNIEIKSINGHALKDAAARAAAAENKAAVDRLSEEKANKYVIEETDLPTVYYGVPIPQTKTEMIMPWRFVSKAQDIKAYCETKAQGNSSMTFPKKNQTTKIFADVACDEKLKIAFRNWGAQNKFCLKANWNDLSHARNVISARIWGDMVRTRADFDSIPELMRNSPNFGAIDGFPVRVFAGGVYQGRYAFTIPKDKWMANMDDENPNHCILCGEDYGSGCFRAPALIDGNDWTDEIHDTVPDNIKTRWNECISFVRNSTDEEFVTGLHNYFNVPSLIDYHIFGLVSCNMDGFGKNQLFMTYDGQVWYASVYDMDATWGNHFMGTLQVAADFTRAAYEDYASAGSSGDGNLMYVRLESLFADAIKERWNEVKHTALSVDSILNRFEKWASICPPYVIEEDYAATTANGAFTEIPCKDTNNIQQIRAFVKARHEFTEIYINGEAENLWNISERTIYTYNAEPAADGTITNNMRLTGFALGGYANGVMRNTYSIAAVLVANEETGITFEPKESGVGLVAKFALEAGATYRLRFNTDSLQAAVSLLSYTQGAADYAHIFAESVDLIRPNAHNMACDVTFVAPDYVMFALCMTARLYDGVTTLPETITFSDVRLEKVS